MKMPDLKQFNPINKSVNSTDVLLGAAAGAFLNGVIKKQIIDRFMGNVAFVQNNHGFISPVLTASLLALVSGYVGPLKKRSTGLFVGALAGGLVPAIAVKAGYMAGFGETVAVNLQGLGALIDEDPRLNGLGYMVQESPQSLQGMSDLAALSMNEDDDSYDGLAELVNVQF